MKRSPPYVPSQKVLAPFGFHAVDGLTLDTVDRAMVPTLKEYWTFRHSEGFCNTETLALALTVIDRIIAESIPKVVKKQPNKSHRKPRKTKPSPI